MDRMAGIEGITQLRFLDMLLRLANSKSRVHTSTSRGLGTFLEAITHMVYVARPQRSVDAKLGDTNKGNVRQHIVVSLFRGDPNPTILSVLVLGALHLLRCATVAS